MKKIEKSDRRFFNVSILYKQATVTNVFNQCCKKDSL